MKIKVMTFNTQHCCGFVSKRIDFELMAEAIDAVAIDIGVANGKIAEYGEDYYCVAEPFAAEKYGICFRKADAEMCKQVEDAFMQLVADGTYISLAEKYGLDTANLKLTAE